MRGVSVHMVAILIAEHCSIINEATLIGRVERYSITIFLLRSSLTNATTITLSCTCSSLCFNKRLVVSSDWTLQTMPISKLKLIKFFPMELPPKIVRLHVAQELTEDQSGFWWFSRNARATFWFPPKLTRNSRQPNILLLCFWHKEGWLGHSHHPLIQQIQIVSSLGTQIQNG